jgi:phosphoglycerate dehydrogenase-like enzyme
MFPAKDQLKICFAHIAYQFEAPFAARATGIAAFQVATREALEARIGEADVLVVSGLWTDALIPRAGRLKFIQSISAGVDQYGKAALAAAGIRLASAQGANARAVAEHALALILALARRLPEARDNQARHHWRGMIGDAAIREDELGGRTLLVVGLGRIGARLAALGRALDMHVIGIKRDPSHGGAAAHEVLGLDGLAAALPRADYIALTCPLTPETTGLINAAALARMKRSAVLVNCARGKVVDEAALIDALRHQAIAGAGIDVTVEEPLAATSPLWDLPNALITPHTGGETRAYESNVLDLMMENLDRLGRGETALRNQVV